MQTTAINQGIAVNKDNTLNFGDFLSKDKQKTDDFIVDGDNYSLRTYDQATKLSKNTELALETVPGTSINSFFTKEKEFVSFSVEGFASTIITVNLEPNTTYRIKSNKENIGGMSTNSSGKIKFSLDLTNGKTQNVSIEKFKQ